MKTTDPIIEKIHSVREALANEQGNDVEKIARAANDAAQKAGRQLETLPPRRLPPTKKAS